MTSSLALSCQSKLHWRFTVHRRICLGLEAQQTSKLLQGCTLHVLTFSLQEDYILFLLIKAALHTLPYIFFHKMLFFSTKFMTSSDSSQCILQ